VLIFIVLLGCFAGFLAAVQEFTRLFFSKSTLQFTVYKQLPAAFFAQVLFIVIYNFQHYLVILFTGVFFILAGFYYLGIISFTKIKFHYHFTLLAMLIAIISALSGLIWFEAIWGIVGFVLSFAFFYSILRQSKDYFLKRKKNVSDLLELFQMINGIFIFILGLITASDRIRFLQKIAAWFLSG